MAIVFVLCAILVGIVSVTTSDLPGFEPRIQYSGPTSNSHLKSLEEFIDFSKYHHFNDLTDILKFTNRTYPNFSYLYSIGNSVQGNCICNSNLAYFTKTNLFGINRNL